MRFCRFAQVTGKPCSDGFSRRVICQYNMDAHCLRDCIRSCLNYQPVDENKINTSQNTVTTQSKELRELTEEQRQQFNQQMQQMQSNVQQSQPRSGGCGGCGGNKQGTNYAAKSGGWSTTGGKW